MNKSNLYSFEKLSEHADSYVIPVQEYFQFLITGDGKKAHCPFTSKMVRDNEFYYAVSSVPLSYEEFVVSLNQMTDFILNSVNRFAVVGVVYAHGDNYKATIAEQVEKYRQNHRVELISKGLTTAWMHPGNKIGTHTDKDKPEDPLWVCACPLAVRRLDPGDEPFMLTTETRRAFIQGMNYVDTINFFGNLLNDKTKEEKISILLQVMERERLFSVSSVTMTELNILYISKKSGAVKEYVFVLPGGITGYTPDIFIG